MNTRQYYYLSTIANYGNLSHAAQALHVSPSALSKFLALVLLVPGFILTRFLIVLIHLLRPGSLRRPVRQE